MSTSVSAAIPVAPVVLRAGDTMPVTSFGPLTRTDFVRYAGAGGDLNPIHHDEEFARAAGMPTVFGMGMLHAGVLGNRLARWVGPDNLRSFNVRFTGQVWPGDMLTLTGTVTVVEDALATIALVVTRNGEDRVLTATASAMVSAGS